MRQAAPRLVPLGLLALLLCVGGRAARAEGDYDARLAAFKTASKSASLEIRTEGQEELAASKDPRAIDVLGRLYGSPRPPKAQGRHLIVSLLARHFDDAKSTDGLAALRTKQADAHDAWLWYRTLVIHGRHAGTEALWSAARDPELPAPLRAAAVEAAATLQEPGVADLAVDLLAALPEDAADRALLVDCLAASLLAVRDQASGDALDKAVDALIAHVAGDTAAESTRVVVGRVLQQLLDSRFAYLDGKDWREHKVRPGATRESAARRLQPVRCADVRSHGARIAFLIDTSENAAQLATPEEQQRLLDTKGDELSRLEVMRRAVRDAIRELEPEQSFAVLAYAHHAVGALPGLEGVLPATPENKAKATSALGKLPLGGLADLHAGLRAAFQIEPAGLADEDEHLAPEAILGGCDTVFLFSHSSSHVDQWVEADPGRRKESARTLPSGSMAYGLYADPTWLQEELDRWRCFRKVKLHAIAFGHAYADVLATAARSVDGFAPPPTGNAGGADRPAAQADDKLLAALKSYREYLKRPSLNKRIKGRNLLALTGNLLALEAFARDYASAEEPVPTVQQVIVDLCCTSFRREEALPIFARWRGRHVTPADAWLWHRALEVAREYEDVRTVHRAAAEAHDPFLRAAAIRAAAKQQDRALLGFIPAWVREIRASNAVDLERSLPIEAMATALYELADAKDEDVYKAAALALLDAFDDENTAKRTRLTIVRNLAAGLEVPPEGLEKNAWVREVRAGGSGVGMEDQRYGAPTFGGLRASGTRICYVIDMSDSMLTPLAPNERMKPKVVTGRVQPRKRRPEDEINWSKVKTRFDLARALLITSLQTLQPNTQFCVIWFGSDADTLKTTKKMMPTTPENVARTVKELRAIKPGAPGAGEHKTGVKWGSLKGETNLHGGLTRALTRTADKPLTGFTYVSAEGLAEGCDTIFLLSDGAPSTDDFVTVDKREPDDHAVEDRETMKKTDDTPELSFPGPYADWHLGRHLLNDIERRNLFRQVEIHCLGIGDANMGLLDRIAIIGLGKARKIGEDKDGE